MPQPVHIISACKKHIVIAMEATHYYNQIERKLAVTNMMWQKLKFFDIQWKAIEEKKKQDNPNVPKISKHENIIK